MIYLDNAATTRVLPEVLEAMLPYFTEDFGNASGVYQPAARAKKAIARARKQVADLIGARPDEIYFTSGGTEADNWALVAALEKGMAMDPPKKHIITSAIEHAAILRTCQYLERERGAEVTYLLPDGEGRIDPSQVEAAIREDTILISVMTANNEIGTLEPVREIGSLAAGRGILFHTDAVQAFGQIPVRVEDLQADMLSASAHKIHGPKGVGCLFVRRSAGIGALLRGGAQERSRRAGTENVPAIVGFGQAADYAGRTLDERMVRVTELRDRLIGRIRKEIDLVRLNGSERDRLPGNVNFSLEYVQGESLLILLDMEGICVSSGSACSSGSLDASHVLRAIGLSDLLARSSVRLSLSEETTQEEVDETADKIAAAVRKLRSMSTLYAAYQKGMGESEIELERKNGE